MAYKLNMTGEALQKFITKYTEKSAMTFYLEGENIDDGTRLIIIKHGDVYEFALFGNITYFTGIKTVATYDTTTEFINVNNFREFQLTSNSNYGTYGVSFCFKVNGSITMNCIGNSNIWSSLNPTGTISFQWVSPYAFLAEN